MSDPKEGGTGRWRRLWSPPKSRWLFGIPVGAFVAVIVGGALYAGGGMAMHAVSSETFCASACHEMATFVTPGWKESPHFRNASGVHASCPDCHMPGPFVPKMIRKAQALREGYHHILGTIDTQAKFDAHKPEMAQRVWDYMKANDSRECRACHGVERMLPDSQSKMARKAHARAQESGKTCIECHQGVAHSLPDEPAAAPEPAEAPPTAPGEAAPAAAPAATAATAGTPAAPATG